MTNLPIEGGFCKKETGIADGEFEQTQATIILK